IPGISPGLRRPSDGRLRGGLGGFGVPPRSSFGARLRSRLPQYGHSVMYGDTSRPQLRQTTKRSGPLAMGEGYVAEGPGPALLWPAPRPDPLGSGAWQAKPFSIASGGADDLPQQFRPVVVRLVDDPLTGGSGALLEQVGDALELVGAAEVLGVLAQPVVQAPAELLGRDHPALGQVDELALEAMAGRQPLVLVEHLVRVGAELLAGLVVLGELLDHRLDQRGQGERVLDVGLGVHRADLDGAEARVRADVVPEVGLVGHHARVDHEADPVLVV